MSDPQPIEGREPPKRAIALAVASVITAGLVALSFYLGGWAFQTRGRSLHEGRLRQVLEAKPDAARVAAGLAVEQMRQVAVARNAEEIAALADRWGGERRAEVLAQGRHAASARAFATADDKVVYVLYFDQAGTMVGFTVASWG